MAELKFTRDHECILVEGETALIGITDYAREALGDLVYIELPEAGKKVGKGDEFAVVRSVKTAAEVYSPSPVKSWKPTITWKAIWSFCPNRWPKAAGLPK